MKITNKSQDKLMPERGIVKKIVNLNIAIIFIWAAGINQ